LNRSSIVGCISGFVAADEFGFTVSATAGGSTLAVCVVSAVGACDQASEVPIARTGTTIDLNEFENIFTSLFRNETN
jgi:hypothetical protein